MSRYQVTVDNQALGHLSRTVEAPDAASAVQAVLRVALGPMAGTVWDAPLINCPTTITVEPLDPLPSRDLKPFPESAA